MPEPRIQYARTSDGVSIAYAVHGDGPPLIFMQGYPFNHLKAALQLESIRVFFEQLARRCTLVRFDHRATGLSQRGRLPASQDNLLADLVAVVSAVGLRPVSLVGLGFGGAIAVRFAVRYPQAVSRLAVGDMSVRPSSSYPGVNRLRAVTDLATADWEIATETLASVMYGWGEAQAREAAAYLRECTSPEAVESMWDLTEDLTDLHRQVRVPTLVFWHKDIAFPPNEAMVELTSLIDGAELAMLEGTWISTEERASDLAEIVLDFICASEQNAAPQVRRSHLSQAASTPSSSPTSKAPPP